MNRTSTQYRNFAMPLRPLMLAGLLMMSCTTVAQEATSLPSLTGEPLRLDKVAKLTLVNSSTIKTLSFSKDIAQSTLQIQSGTFDINTSANVKTMRDRPTGMFGPPNDLDVQTLTLGVSKLFRTGISSNFSVQLERDDQQQVTSTIQNQSTVSFIINVPLLKGFGYTASAAADETAARFNSEAAVKSYYHTISQTLLASIIAYWDYKAAMVLQGTLQDSQQRVSGWVTEAGKAVEATGNSKALREQYAPQLSRLRAFLSDQERKVNDAKNQVTKTKMALAVAMGIPSDQVHKIGEPVEVFPTDWSRMIVQFDLDRARQKWVAAALEKRFDLQAAKLNEQGAATQLAKARHNLSPQLDLELSAGRSGYQVGDGFSNYTKPLTTSGDKLGSNLAITLNLSYPLGNNTAQGLLGVATASYQQNLLALNELSRNTRIEVATGVETLTNSLKTLKSAQEAVNNYRPVLEKYKNSQRSLVSDPSILFNLIDIEKDIVSADSNFIQALLDLAKTVVTLRYQVGVLIDVNTGTNEATLKNITILPEL